MLAPRARARSILCPVVPPPTPSRPSKVAATSTHPPPRSTRRSSRHLSRNRIFRPAASIALDIATERFSPTATPSPPVRARRKKDEGQRPTERGGKRIDLFRKSVESRPGRSRDAHLRRRRRPRREARRPSRSPERRPEGTRRRRRDEDVSLNRGGANARRRRRRRSIDRICRLLQNELSKKWRERDRNRSTRGTPPRCARRRASTYLSPHGDAKLPGIEAFLMKRVGRSSQSMRAEKARRRRDPRAARATFASSGTVFRKPKNRRESKSTTRAPSEQTCA